jgi:hypothetical protein
MVRKSLPFLVVFLLAITAGCLVGIALLPSTAAVDIPTLSMWTVLGPLSVFALSSGASELSNLVMFCLVGIAMALIPTLVLRKLSNLLAFAAASIVWALYGVFLLTLAAI